MKSLQTTCMYNRGVVSHLHKERQYYEYEKILV